MKYIKYTFGLLGFVILWSACSEDLFTQVVEIDLPNHESGISISADFLQNYNDVVRLQGSKGIQEAGDLENILGATVVLKESDVIVKPYEDQSTTGSTGHGYYVNFEDHELVAGTSYTLEVEKEGFEKAIAVQVMPIAVEISKLEYVEEGYVDPDGYRTDKMRLTFTDPIGQENYYGIKAFVLTIDSNGNTFRNQAYIYNDIDPLLERGVNQEIVMSDGTFEGKEVTFDFSLGRKYSGVDSVTVQLFSTTRDKYLYERSLRIYEDSGFNPFVEPVIVHENVEGGHGLFSLSHFASKTIDIN